MAKTLFGDETTGTATLETPNVTLFGDTVDVPRETIPPEPVLEPLGEEAAFERAGQVWDTSVEDEIPLDIANQFFYDVGPSDPDDFGSPIPDQRVGFSEEFKKQWTGAKAITKIPITGGVIGAIESARTIATANRLTDESFDYDSLNLYHDKVNRNRPGLMVSPRTEPPSAMSRENDQKFIAQAFKDFEFEQRGKKFGGKVAAGLSQMPTWMVEFAATGGLASLGDDVAKKAGEKLLRKHLETTAGKIAVKAAGLTTGAVIRSSTGLLPRVGEKAINRQELIELGLAEQEGWATSFAKAWGDVTIESFSEETGGLITKGGGALLNKLPFGKKFITSLQEGWVKFTGGSSGDFATRMLTKAGYSSVLGEMGEERVATILREATGVSDRKGGFGERIWEGMKEDFQPENLGSELVTLLAPASVRRGMTIGQSLTKGVDVPTEAEQLDQVIEVGEVKFDNAEDAKGYAERVAEVAVREDKDVTINTDLADNTVTVEEIVEEVAAPEISTKPVAATETAVDEPQQPAIEPSEEIGKLKPDDAQAEQGAVEPVEPDIDASQSEWDKYEADVEAFFGKEDLSPRQIEFTSIETKIAEREAETVKEISKIPISVRRATTQVIEKQIREEAGGSVDAGFARNSQQKADNARLGDFTKTASKKDLQLLKKFEIREKVRLSQPTPQAEAITGPVVEFVQADNSNHTVLYNGKIVEMGYAGNQKDQFKRGSQRIFDNLGTGKTPTDVGYIKTPGGKYYKVTRDSRSAKLVPESEVLAQFAPQTEAAPTVTEAPEVPKEKRIISKDAFDAALKRLGTIDKLKAGLDPQQIKDAAIVGGYLVETGVRKFAEWSAKMIEAVGENVRPHLKSIWDGIVSEQATQPEKPKKKPAKPRVTPKQKQAEKDIRQRGFVSSIKTALPNLKVEGTYVPRSTDELSIKAKNLVKDDIQKAENLALKGDSDKSVATASELLKHYSEQAKLATDQTAKDAFYDKAAKIANDIAAKLTEAGRTVQAAIILTRLTPEGQVRFAAREIQRHNEKIEKSKGGLFGLKKKIPELTPEQTKKILNEMEAIEAMEPGEAKAKRFQKLQNSISDLVPTPLFNKLITLWKAGLLTGIKTHGLNIMSTTANVSIERTARIPAAMVDKVVSLFTGKRTVTAGIKGLGKGVAEGKKRAVDYFVTGYDDRNIGTKLDYKRVNMGKGRLARTLQTYTEVVFRSLGAEDQPFYYAAKTMSLYEQAKVAAINEGLKGKKAQKFVDNLMQDPTEDMVKNASKDAEAAVFQNKTALGDLAKGIQGLGKGAGEIVVPFGRTPSAVAMQIINYSPAGAVKTIIENIGKGKFNQREFATGLGRSIVGAIPLVIGAALWENDMLTLDYPKTQKERDLWRTEGRKANSVKVDGKWRTIQSFGPGGNLLVIGGHFKRAFQDSGSPSEAMAAAIFGSGKSFTEQTFLQGINQFTAALNDPERSGPRLARGLVSSVIPTIVGDVARAGDPLERRTGTVGGRVKAKIPGLRQTLEPQITVLGDERKASANPLEIMIDPTRPSKDISTPLVKELRRLSDAGFNVTPSQLGNKDGFDILTPAENTKLWRRAGELTKTVLEEWVTSDGYKSIDNDLIKSKSIAALTTRMQAAAKAEVVGIKLKQGVSVLELAEAGLLAVDGLEELKFFTQ